MGQEDKLRREIDRVGQLLALLLDKLLHKNLPADTFNYIDQELQSKLDLDLDKFLLMNDREDISYLIENRHLSLDNLRVFGDLLYQLAYKDADRKHQLLKKALILYEYVQDSGNGTLYYDLRYKIQELRKAL